MSLFVLLLLTIVVVHILDDFGLQQITHLSELKQKQWWVIKCAEAKTLGLDDVYKYRNDYKICLLLHAFKWSCMIMLPFVYFGIIVPIWLALALVLSNTVIHAIIDDIKANKFKINLIVDQLLHILQILLTIVIVMCIA